MAANILRVCRSFGSIPIIFSVLFSLMLVCGCVISPPFQTPDEYNHFLRSVQISEGHIIGRKLGTRSGGDIAQGATELAGPSGLFQDLPFQGAHRATIAAIQSFDSIGWDGPRMFIGFSNTVIYGPVLYLPSAVAIYLTRHLAWPVLQSYYMSRVTNAVIFMISGIFALALAQRGRVVFCFLLALPMSADLAMSVSQDAQVIALSAVLAALLTNHRRADPWSWIEWAAIGVGFGVLGMAKLPYVIMSGIAFALVGRREFLAALTCPLIAVVMTVAWVQIGLAPVNITHSHVPDVSAPAQVMMILHDPAVFFGALFATIEAQRLAFAEQFVGVLGWLDILLPNFYYNFAIRSIETLICGGILAGLVLEIARRNYWFLADALVILVLAALTVTGVFLALYVTWNPVGAPAIAGIQGRYFIPLAFFLLLLMPDLRNMKRRRVALAVNGFSSVLCFGWMGLSAVMYFRGILTRYWLQ